LLKKDSSLNAESSNFQMGFISGIIDSEGHVDKIKSSISIVNTNKKINEKM